MNIDQVKEIRNALVKISRYLIWFSLLIVGLIILLVSLVINPSENKDHNILVPSIQVKTISALPANTEKKRNLPNDAWKAPGIRSIPAGKTGEVIRYGRALVISTASYLGPRGSVAHITNGMNCQNCHEDAGTKLFSNDFAGFIATYPRKSSRSGRLEPASARIAECFERSLNGRVPDTAKKEVQAILAYMKWLGKDVGKDRIPAGGSTEKLNFMVRAADPKKGQLVFVAKCQSCHGTSGEGLLNPDKISYTYPPLWGPQSYNDGAGMYRLSNLAGFIKNNMPYGASYQYPQLPDEESWDVAAFINSQPRPHKKQQADYPDVSQKPIDLPFGPYADKFSARQHKYGPYLPIQDAIRLKKLKLTF